MFAIFKRELRSYFTSLVGYVVIGVMLAFTGLYYSANCLVYGTSDFSTVLYSTTLVMLFLLPALTMRSFADERRNKTDQLLLTSPVGIPSIVMGKYFAQLAVFAVPMAAAAIMPLVLTAFGTISLTSKNLYAGTYLQNRGSDHPGWPHCLWCAPAGGRGSSGCQRCLCSARFGGYSLPRCCRA